MPGDLTAIAKRAAHPAFVATFSYRMLVGTLPLRLDIDEDVPPSPKSRYRSHYRYLGPGDLADEDVLAPLSPFEIALRLVDFANLRDLLASRLYADSDRGQVPFDPVSMLLCLLLRIEARLAWRKLAQHLAGPQGAEWRRLFGFDEGVTPSASGLRYFGDTLGPAFVEALSGRLVRTLVAEGLAPRYSTFPGDNARCGVTICRDGQLHTARDKLRKCRCDDGPCEGVCPKANPRDLEARVIHYSGHNKHAECANGDKRGKTVFGYRSTADRLIDDRFATAWTVRTSTYPANTDEHTVFEQELVALGAQLGDVAIGEFLADAGLGYGPALTLLYERGIRRMVDIRAAGSDSNPERQRQRGYDEHGRPLCIHGFAMTANGHDYQRRRTKYICAKRCLRQREREVPDCPFQRETACGQVVNVGLAMPDGSSRLAREIPYRSPTWRARYGRRSLAESRNGTLQGFGLLRLPCHGLRRARSHIGLADFLANLHNLGRLVAQASALAA